VTHPPCVAVIGGGPIGSCAAVALAERGFRVAWFEANHPAEGDFSRVPMSCPWAAGQVLGRSFEPGTLAAQLGIRTLERLIALHDAGRVDSYPRPWLVCAGKGSEPAEAAAREALDTAWRSGALDGFTRLSRNELESFAGLRADEIEFAVCDPWARGVDPRMLAVQLARRAAETPGVEPHFGSIVTQIEGTTLHTLDHGVATKHHADAVLICVGVQAVRGSEAPLELNGAPLHTLIPAAEATYLHVFDHRSPTHMPSVLFSAAGPATIARYEVFGAGRAAIVPHLPEAARAFDVNPLLTDVPGLRRMLDTHFSSRSEAEASTDAGRDTIAELLSRLVAHNLLPGCAGGPAITETTIAKYLRHLQPDGAPTIEWLEAQVPTLYVQPTNGRGLTQCAGLGEWAAALLADVLT